MDHRTVSDVWVTERRVTVELTDAPIRLQQGTRAKRYRPRRVVITYRREEKSAWRVIEVRMTGPVIRRGGAQGSGFGLEKFLSCFNELESDLPEEYRSIVQAHLPKED